MSACHNVSWLLCVSQRLWELHLLSECEVCALVPVCVPVRCESWRASSVCMSVPAWEDVLTSPWVCVCAASSEPTCNHTPGCRQVKGDVCISAPTGGSWEGAQWLAARQEEGQEAGVWFGAATECL